LIIAEISNCQFGDFEKAKELIRVAHESGADVVKAQAIEGNRVYGSMHKDFYKQCAFTMDEYKELIQYARSIGSDLFYSIFDTSLYELLRFQNYIKISRSQYLEWTDQTLLRFNTPYTFVSIPDCEKLEPMDCSNVLYVTPYNIERDDLHMIDDLSKHYKNVGLSDHTKGPETCIKAIEHFGVMNIEVHFTLEHEMEWGYQVYRDTIFGKTPAEFEAIAKKKII
jgi:sialic acid synthase SpsE